MKKFISFVCVLAVLVGMLALGCVGFDAAAAAQTIVDVKSGDEVTYVLTLGDVPERVVGCDFSIYYDSSALELESCADYSNSTDKSDWNATINTKLDGEVRGNWSILSGVNFSDKRNFMTLNLKATKEASAHLSYYVRYMYDEHVFDSDDRPQITDYTFSCDVTVNGKTVLENAQPELNVEEKQSTGSFVNSVTGKGEDADVELVSGRTGSSGSSGSGNNSGTGKGSDDSGSGSKTSATSAPTGKTNDPGKKNATIAPAATDAQGNTIAPADDVATPSETAKTEGGSSAWIWILIGILALVACGGIAYFVVSGKKKAKDEEE